MYKLYAVPISARHLQAMERLLEYLEAEECDYMSSDDRENHIFTEVTFLEQFAKNARRITDGEN